MSNHIPDSSGVIASESFYLVEYTQCRRSHSTGASAAILVASEAKQSRAKADFLVPRLQPILKKRLEPQELNAPRLEPGNEWYMGLFFKVEAASSRLELNSLQDAGSTLQTVTHSFAPCPRVDRL
ncbi:hypothetical protein [Desulfonatronovibrio magnus]|uniref:hypothetical protein n=1 Tax=Desulfonatronovibrio magnus TaxID=698827 RepID=UPI0005EBD882|nr:hypothetical protein [Desulfonatronovibrio magnus]